MRFPTSRQTTAKFFFALGHPRRLLIIEELSRAPEGMTFEAIGVATRLADASLSHHIRFLNEAGLLSRKIKDRYSIYRLNTARISQMTGLLPPTFAQAA